MYKNELLQLREVLMNEYLLYRQGLISQKEYCIRIKPLDMAIGKLEMATLQDTPVLQVASLQHSLKPEH